ncbi:DUF952 domain-containing protein [Propionibacteriaceae bacterium Y1685]|uniref:DUF952 domain-containing protein n=1 Tax=Microlunatus sp. Y1700 TaxID=3418487 RepID=UPI003B78BEEC
MIIWHLTEQRLWEQARPAGEYSWSTRGRRLSEVGFIHASHPHQLDQVAANFFADVEGALVVLGVDTEVLAQHQIGVVSEPPAPGVDELFPHVYGPIPVAAVRHVRRVRLAANGLVDEDEISGDPVG